MKAENFVYWLQGFLELANPEKLDEKQVQMIKNHLNLVFYHEIDKSYGFDQKQTDEAQKIHDGKLDLSSLPLSLTGGYQPNKTGMAPPPSPYTITETTTDPKNIIMRC